MWQGLLRTQRTCTLFHNREPWPVASYCLYRHSPHAPGCLNVVLPCVPLLGWCGWETSTPSPRLPHLLMRSGATRRLELRSLCHRLEENCPLPRNTCLDCVVELHSRWATEMSRFVYYSSDSNNIAVIASGFQMYLKPFTSCFLNRWQKLLFMEDHLKHKAANYSTWATFSPLPAFI